MTLAVLVVFTLVALARVFQMAGQPAWAAFVPVINTLVLLRISRLSLWWAVLLAVPVINIFLMLAVSVAVARRFRHSSAFAAGLWLLPFVFYPVLAFGEQRSRYCEA